MELNPFNHLAFGPPPHCLRLKTKVTFSPPRLATSEWLVLTRRESHPLYDTTYARPHKHSLVEQAPFLFSHYSRMQLSMNQVSISVFILLLVKHLSPFYTRKIEAYFSKPKTSVYVCPLFTA